MHRLALGLGRTVAEIERGMPARELDDWAEYYAAEPWGAYRDNLHAGIIASVLVNGRPGRKQKTLGPGDFVLRSASDKRRGDTAKALARLRAIGKRKNVDGPS